MTSYHWGFEGDNGKNIEFSKIKLAQKLFAQEELGTQLWQKGWSGSPH